MVEINSKKNFSLGVNINEQKTKLGGSCTRGFSKHPYCFEGPQCLDRCGKFIPVKSAKFGIASGNLNIATM